MPDHPDIIAADVANGIRSGCEKCGRRNDAPRESTVSRVLVTRVIPHLHSDLWLILSGPPWHREERTSIAGEQRKLLSSDE